MEVIISCLKRMQLDQKTDSMSSIKGVNYFAKSECTVLSNGRDDVKSEVKV